MENNPNIHAVGIMRKNYEKETINGFKELNIYEDENKKSKKTKVKNKKVNNIVVDENQNFLNKKRNRSNLKILKQRNFKKIRSDNLNTTFKQDNFKTPKQENDLENL